MTPQMATPDEPQASPHLRSEMLTALMARLNSSDVSYCALGGHWRFPEACESDVDFMVHRGDEARVPQILQAAAEDCQGQVVQAIRHETGGCYYVMAKQAGETVAYLHPDCTTDYRRNGRLWLHSKEVLAHSRREGIVCQPEPAWAFLYYAIKKVLKQSVEEEHVRRLRVLYLSAPAECAALGRRFWSQESVQHLAGALASGEVSRVRWYLPQLLRELKASRPVEPWPDIVWQTMREWGRVGDRLARPTGLQVAMIGGNREQKARLAVALERNLRPAFRRTNLWCEQNDGGGFRSYLARVRSTLVISQSSEGRAKPGLGAGLLIPGDMTVEQATSTALAYMAERTQRRLGNAGAV